MHRPDLNSAEAIDGFVDVFYARVLSDAKLAPLFVEVAKIDLTEHLPRIKAYWRKMLLGDTSYQRHMMRKHRAVDREHPLRGEHYERWLVLFELTLLEQHCGPHTQRAKSLARRVARNMRRNLEQCRSDT